MTYRPADGLYYQRSAKWNMFYEDNKDSIERTKRLQLNLPQPFLITGCNSVIHNQDKSNPSCNISTRGNVGMD